jgi:NADPH2:quinone reductase
MSGGPEVLEPAEVPPPELKPGHILVRAHTIGVGKPDVLFRTGAYRWRPPLPAIPGNEMTGYVEAVGSGVNSFHVGQPVHVAHLPGGCYAEYISVPQSAVTPLPPELALDNVIGLLNFQVAWAMLVDAAAGVNNRTLYINGAAGGVGTAVIQLAKSRGIRVIAGCGSDEKCAFALSQGASQTVNYSRQNVVEEVLRMTDDRGVDLILDHIVGKDFTENLRMLAKFGLIVSFNMLGGWPEKDLFREMRAHLPKSPAVRCFTLHSYDDDPGKLRSINTELLHLFAEGKIATPIYRQLSLMEARCAHEMLDARQVMGKLILKP